jgi:Zn finger protein HypA/HybF involved in hydrogenase expression
MKQDCPFCGKAGIDGRHINMCSQNPKNLDAVVPQSLDSEIETTQEIVSEPVIVESVALHIEEKKPSISRDSLMKCPDCGSNATQLNALDCRCPKCGDIQFIKITKPTGS